MKFYNGDPNDPIFAVYASEGLCYPVFAEKYGTESFPFTASLAEITDDETVASLNKYMKPYEDGKPRVYMAGPLFNEGDRYTNLRNSDALRAAGYTTFLPQEIVITEKSAALVKAGCFYMDLKAIKLCDVLLANCNGIEIDSGTAAEIGLAYALGKKILVYKSDVRNYYNEVNVLNNFVAGLVDGPVLRSIEDVLAALSASEEKSANCSKNSK